MPPAIELTVNELRDRIRNNKMTFPSQVPAFAGLPKAERLWRMAALFFVRGWSYPAVASRHGLCEEYVRLLIKQWARRALQLGLIQEIPFPDPPVNLKQLGKIRRKHVPDASVIGPMERDLRSQGARSIGNSKPAPLRRYSLGEAVIDLKDRTIKSGGRKLHLTSTECAILQSLIAKMDSTVPRYDLAKQLGQANGNPGLHSLRPLIRSLRRKLEPDPASPRYLLTDFRIGYRLQTSR